MSLGSLQDTGLDNFEGVEMEIERYMQMDTNTQIHRVKVKEIVIVVEEKIGVKSEIAKVMYYEDVENSEYSDDSEDIENSEKFEGFDNIEDFEDTGDFEDFENSDEDIEDSESSEDFEDTGDTGDFEGFEDFVDSLDIENTEDFEDIEVGSNFVVFEKVIEGIVDLKIEGIAIE